MNALISYARAIKLTLFVACLLTSPCYGSNHSKAKNERDGKQQNWHTTEYSGVLDDKARQTALLSKAFAWLSGSPADNQVLSIGKKSQFFGFVALRYESGRSANRGSIGRAMYEISNAAQRQIMLTAVQNKTPTLVAWESARNTILRSFEDALDSEQTLDMERIRKLGQNYGWLNAKIALSDAEAIAKFERSLSPDQRATIQSIRARPDRIRELIDGKQLFFTAASNTEKENAYMEDLFAKAFSWLTGDFKQRQVIPKGQPAQFFGFVALRHKSRHAISRGKIAKSFKKILNTKQLKHIERAKYDLKEWLSIYFETRTSLLREQELLREAPNLFNIDRYRLLAEKLGETELTYAAIEARAYVEINKLMSEKQRSKMMQLRHKYVLEEHQTDSPSLAQLGAKIANLCTSCHENTSIAPGIEYIIGNKIAQQPYDYSIAMLTFAKLNPVWTETLLDEFLKSPNAVVPGTSMSFKGLENRKDRRAVIHYLTGK